MSIDLRGAGSAIRQIFGYDYNPNDMLSPQSLSTPQHGGTAQTYQDPEYGNPIHFSFCDATAHVVLPFIVKNEKQAPTYELPGVQLVSISTHRDVYPVVASGRRGIKGFTKGHRTVAGTLGFTVLGESPWAECMRAYARWRGVRENLLYSHPDELPPFDILLTFFTEAGDTGFIQLRSVQILDSAQNVNINDIQLSQTFSFMAAEATELINLPTPLRTLSNNRITAADEQRVYHYWLEALGLDPSRQDLKMAAPNMELIPADPILTVPTIGGRN